MGSKPSVLILILADLGTDHRCRKVAGALSRRGYLPIVLADRPLRPPGAAWDGIEVRYLTGRSHLLGFLRAWAEYLWRATPILLSDRSDIWIVEDGTPLLWAALLGRLRGKRVIYDARELLLETPAIASRPTRRLLWRAWLGIGEALCGPLLTVSPGFQREYRAAHPGRAVHLLPNVPELKEAPPARAIGEGSVRLLYQGALRPDSGLRDLLPALARAPRHVLDVYGDGPDGEALRDLAFDLGLAERVHFHGAVPFEALAAPLAASHIGVHLLVPSCKSFDLTLSNKLFDSIHALAPVLLGETAAHREFLAREPVGVIPADRSPEALLAALETVRAGYAGYVEACRAARQRWHWEAFGDGLDRALAGTAS